MRVDHRVLPVVFLLLIIPLAAGDHFHSASLSWERVSGTTVKFTLVSAWTTEYQPFIEQAGGSGIEVGQAIQLQGLDDPVLKFGDGVASFVIVKTRVVAVDNDLKQWRGEFVWEHTYPSSGGPWIAEFTGCCRQFEVKTNVDSTSGYSPRIAMLPRQVLLPTDMSSNKSTTFSLAAYDGGSHPSQEGRTGRYKWELLSPSQSSYMIDALTGMVNSSNATSENLRVKVSDVTSGIYSMVEFEVRVLHRSTEGFPKFDLSYPATRLPLPAENELVASFEYQFELRFIFDGAPPAAADLALDSSALPDSVTLSSLAPVVYNMTTGFHTTFRWTPSEAQEGWTAVCVQVCNKGVAPPVCSSQQCFSLIVLADAPPALVAHLPEALASTPVGMPLEWHMGLSLNITLVATDRMAQNMQIAAVGAPSGASMSELVTEQESDAVTGTRVFTWEPDPKAGGSEGTFCFEARDGAVASPQTCFAFRVPKCKYKVREGEALVDIAERFGTSWLQLWALNKKTISRPEGHGLEGSVDTGFDLHVGQLVLVKEGDTLERIAARFGTTLRQMVNLNAEMTPARQLLTGQLLCLVPSSCTERA